MRSSSAFSRVAFLLLGLSAASASRAAATVCEEPAEESFAAIAFVNHEPSSLDGRAGATNQENQDFDVLVTGGSGRFAWGFAHRYLIFDFSEIEPQTNAHLHTSFAPLHWRFEGQKTLRLSAAVALSASSNVMGHPKEWESEASQLLAGLVATVRVSNGLSLRYGLCGDHRFGEYRLYPAAGIAWRFSPAWLLELGFPSSRLRFDATDSLSTGLQIAPDGNEWHVKDREFERGSQLVYEAIALAWTTEWRVGSRLMLSLEVGRQLGNRYEMTLADGERVAVSGEPANRVGLGIRWRF